MLGRGLAVDLLDQPAAPPLGARCAMRDQLARQRAADLRALRLIIRQRDEQLAIAAADPRREPAIDEHHARARPIAWPPRVSLCNRRVRPGHQRAVRIRRIGGRERDRDRLLAFLACIAQQIDRAGLRELRRAQAGHEVAAPDAAGFLEPAQHRIHRAESARQLLDRRHIARDHAVARQQLLRHGRGPRRGRCRRRRHQRPAALGRRRNQPPRSERRRRATAAGRARVAPHRRAAHAACRW